LGADRAAGWGGTGPIGKTGDTERNRNQGMATRGRHGKVETSIYYMFTQEIREGAILDYTEIG